jgi:TetR/AcrR family fatty acid metabolism transcriptional regulator
MEKSKRKLLQKDRVDQILKAAEKIFARKGFYLTTVEDIAKKAGIGKGTIYLYFHNKRDLFFSVLENKLDLLLKKIKKGIEEGKTASDKIKLAIEVHLKFLEENGDFFKIMQGFPEGLKRELGERLKGGLIERQSYYIEVIDKLIQEAIDKGEIRPLNSRKLAVILMGILHSLTVYWVSQKEKISLSDDKSLAYKVFWEGVRKGN